MNSKAAIILSRVMFFPQKPVLLTIFVIGIGLGIASWGHGASPIQGLFGPLVEGLRIGQTEPDSVSPIGMVRAQVCPTENRPSESNAEGLPLYYIHDPALSTPPEYAPYPEYPVTTYDHWAAATEEGWQAEFLPQGIIYPAYLAGRKESRMESIFTHAEGYGWLWDIALGGRAALFRYGNSDPVEPEGFQIDLEGAALLRLDIERHRDLAATDYRAGVPLTYGTKHWQYKFAYYHVSSHLGDNYLLAHLYPRVQYVRDEFVLGGSWKPVSSVRLYGEAGWAFNTGATTSPWEFQLGAEYSPVYDSTMAKRGTPFAAVNGHLFEELNFGGYINAQIGWQWRSAVNGRFRVGAEFFDGCDDQFQFHAYHQRKYGLGIWYDF